MSTLRAREAEIGEILARAGVAVRPLEWKRAIEGTLSRAETIIDTYRVWTHYGADGRWFWCLNGVVSGEVKNEAEAKAAAQSDYEARILSAIATPAGGEVEPVAAEFAMQLRPMDSSPLGHEAMEPAAIEIHEGSWAVVVGTNGKPVGWFDAHATFAHRIYRNSLLTAPNPAPSGEAAGLTRYGLQKLVGGVTLLPVVRDDGEWVKFDDVQALVDSLCVPLSATVAWTDKNGLEFLARGYGIDVSAEKGTMGRTLPLYAAPPSPQVEITDAMVEAAWRVLDGLAVVTHDDVRAALTAALSPTGGTRDPAFLPGPSAVQRSRPSGNTPDLVARLRDGIVVQQAGPSALIGTPDFTATVALMREAADRLESLSTIERQRDEAAAAVDAFAEICDELGCERDNEAGLQAAHALKAEVARLTEALKQHERILLIAAVRRAAEIAAPLWLKAADNAIAALQGGRG